VPGAHEMARHLAPHHAEADEPDRCHVCPCC
jgi:hypothetical protein